MGRVEEAMRRAAEAPADPTGAGVLPGDESAVDQAADVFPAEAPDRPRLRRVEMPADVRAGAARSRARPDTPTISPGSLGTAVDSKTVIDQETDQASKEQYRRLATSLYSVREAGDLRVLMVASAVPGEGKSLTAANLAMTFSESYQRRVLLIDGDLRRPSLHTVFNVPASPGLSDGSLAPDASTSAFHTLSPTLTLLPAGEPTDDPTAVLASDRMRQLIEGARQHFDWVILDTPPVGLLADANVVAGMTDGAVLVVRAESTDFEMVQRAVATLGRERVLGVVLNRARVDRSGPYDYRGYYGSQGRAPGRPGTSRR